MAKGLKREHRSISNMINYNRSGGGKGQASSSVEKLRFFRNKTFLRPETQKKKIHKAGICSTDMWPPRGIRLRVAMGRRGGGQSRKKW